MHDISKPAFAYNCHPLAGAAVVSELDDRGNIASVISERAVTRCIAKSPATNIDNEPRILATGKTNLVADKQLMFSGVVVSFTSVNFNAANKFSAIINWGDGTSSAGQIVFNSCTGKWDVLGTHKYNKNKKTYSLLISIIDANGIGAAVTSTLKT